MTLLNKTNTLVIVPAFNEQDSIVSVIKEIKTTGFPFVVIDDGSTDETRNRAISAGSRTISLPFNAGVGGALKCGFQFAVKNGFHAVIQCDADGQHPTETMQNLVHHANEHSSHLVVGSRFSTDITSMRVSKPRKAIMQVMAKLASPKSEVSLSDTTSGFRLIAEPLLGEFALRFPRHYLGDTYGALGIASSHNYNLGEIPTPFSDRLNGGSSASRGNAVLNIIKVLLIQQMGLQIKIKDFEKPEYGS